MLSFLGVFCTGQERIRTITSAEKVLPHEYGPSNTEGDETLDFGIYMYLHMQKCSQNQWHSI